MSAFIVSREHIEYLVRAAQSSIIMRYHDAFRWYHDGKWHELDHTFARAAEVGQMLWDENIKSVHARYPEDTLDTLPGPIGETYVYQPRPFRHKIKPIDTMQAIKAAHCYRYQSCEHKEWEQSEAYAFIEALIDAAVHVLPGYDDAQWEIDAA